MSQAIVVTAASSSSTGSSYYRGADGEKRLIETIHAYVRKNPIDLDMIKFLVEENERITSEITDAVAPFLLPELARIVASYVRQTVLNAKVRTPRFYADNVLEALYSAAEKRKPTLYSDYATDINGAVEYCLSIGAVIGARIGVGILQVQRLERYTEEGNGLPMDEARVKQMSQQQLKEPAMYMVRNIIMPYLKRNPASWGQVTAFPI